MKNPFKIIHKFKNNNNKIQYHIYIFIGSLVDDEVLKILNFFKNKSFYETISTISKKNFKTIEEYYGEYWYNFFFCSQHLIASIKKINEKVKEKKEIISHLGKEWYEKHINVNIKNSFQKNIPFSFSSNYQNVLIKRNKLKSLTIKKELDFKTYKDEVINEEQIGGTNIETITEEIEKENDEKEEEKIETFEDLDEEVIDDFNLDELTKLYSTENIEDNKEIKETSKLISKAIDDKSWEKKEIKLESDYDSKLDNVVWDSNLDQTYNKTFITSQYIFIDDNIKTIRNKICVSISLNEKFGKNLKFLPEYQYFWSEYFFNKNIDRVMIGQKWVRRNELLKIDIKPNENLKTYENLRGNLSYLRDSFGFKMKREDDEHLILRHYSDYITNNEIFMVDILNELGINYKVESEKIKNLYDVFINIYYPLVSFERLDKIILLLNGEKTKESEFNYNSFLSINNDMKMEKEVYEIVEKVKMEEKKYDNLFFQTYIIQSIIHINILDPKNITGTVSNIKFNLYRIFNNFILSDRYPFIQYMTKDNQVSYKYYTKSNIMDDQETLTKWFELTPYGLSFKIKKYNEKKGSNEKFISINFLDNGRIEYKITWKEEEKATIENIYESYAYIQDLINKINSENKKLKIIPPDNNRFKFAFINTIQKFNLPEKYKINHNDLSEFARLFYPFISLVIEPKKRVSKNLTNENKTSKYGTYLRYKRISNYENVTKMHLRILYFLRNYELNDRDLIDEISKQFNITSENAAKQLDYVKDKYGKVIKKSKKVLKKLKSMPKSKPPGIGIDIQGRERDKYKIRIAGARDKNQLDEIINFVKILIYLYSETYLYKKSKYQKLKSQLVNLNKIAKRRNKVNEFVEYDKDINNVKAITALDKSRLGYKPEEGQNQWTRNCQNSGNDKKRRPIIISEDQIDKLLKMGYKMNDKTGFYEKLEEIKEKGKTKKVTLRVVKLPGEDGKFNYFACDPKENKDNTYIGFLSRGNNPSNLCAPCCFKKDPLLSVNKKKKNYFLKCTGDALADEKVEKISNDDMTDKVYILQDTNKIQEGRFIQLQKYLDIFFNKIWKHDNVIKNHYLIESKSGYFFKYTVKDDLYHYIASIANIYSITINDIKDKLAKFMEEDKDEKYFTYLNNGEIKETFQDKKAYIEYIKTSNYLEYDIVGELISIPGVIDKDGINVYILEKRTKIIKKYLEKDVYIDRYFMKCLNSENYDMIKDDKTFIILLKEGKYYFPLYKLKKEGKKDKKIILTKKYNSKEYKYLLDELNNYFEKSCINNIINKIEKLTIFNSKTILSILNEKNIDIKYQLIDKKNKVLFILLKDNFLLPVNPSGTHYNYNYKYFDNKFITFNLKQTIEKLKEIEKKIKMNYIPTSVFYKNINKDKYIITSIYLENGLNIPIKEETITEKIIKKYNLTLKKQNIFNDIDEKIVNMRKSYDYISKEVKSEQYESESYNLFRLELSLFLFENPNIKDKIIKIVKDQNVKKSAKKNEIRNILFTNLVKKVKNSMVNIVKEHPNLENYNVNNLREYCNVNKTKEKCNLNYHCLWASNNCKIQLKYNQLINYINKVIEELILDKIAFKELIQEGDYFVSDIVDYKLYTNRPDTKIITTSNFNISNIMRDIFGKDKIPSLGRKKTLKKDEINIEEDYPELIELGNLFIQPIISNMDSIIRAYVNSLYWINNKLYDVESRNLGYISNLQTQITYLLKAKIIDFVINNKNNKKISDEIKSYFKNKDGFFDSAINKFRKSNINSTGKIELLILSYIFDHPIIVTDNYNKIKFIFNNGNIEVNKNNINKYDNMDDSIRLKFDYEQNSKIPFKIYSIYRI